MRDVIVLPSVAVLALLPQIHLRLRSPAPVLCAAVEIHFLADVACLHVRLTTVTEAVA